MAAAQAEPVWKDILKKNSALRGRLDSVLGTNSDAVWRSTCKRLRVTVSHSANTSVNCRGAVVLYQDVVTSRVCHDLPLSCNVAGECISEEDAAKIFELGNIEAECVLF